MELISGQDHSVSISGAAHVFAHCIYRVARNSTLELWRGRRWRHQFDRFDAFNFKPEFFAHIGAAG